MINAIKNRNPWAAGVIVFLLGPIIGMCYLNRGRLALLYLGAEILLLALAISVLNFPILGATPGDRLSLISVPLGIAGTIQGVLIARRRDRSERLRWYARRFALVPVVCVLSLVLVSLGIRTYFYEPFDIPSTSMIPNLNPGDAFIVSRRAYDRVPPQRGDVVVFNLRTAAVQYVKRIVGLPGDHIQMANGIVILNGAPVPQQSVESFQNGRTSIHQLAETLPDGKTYRILDAAGNSMLDDTPVYVVPDGHYFVLGDHRHNSVDSRAMGPVGFVEGKDIVGKVVRRYWDGTQHRPDWSKID